MIHSCDFAGSNIQLYSPPIAASYPICRVNTVESSRRHKIYFDRPFISKVNKRSFVKFSDQIRRNCMTIEGTSASSLNLETISPRITGGTDGLISQDINDFEDSHSRPKMFRNRFLNFVRISSVLNDAAESFFKSEIRRRLFVTALLIVVSRVGYFIPLPGFDRRLIPQDYLTFVSGSVGKQLIPSQNALMQQLFYTFIASFATI